MPTLHQHLLHTCYVQIVFLACGSVAPAPPLPPAPVTRGANLAVQVKLHFTIIKRHGKLCTAGMKVESTRLAVVDKTRHVLLAGVAVAWDVSGRPRQKLEGTLGVERVDDGG